MCWLLYHVIPCKAWWCLYSFSCVVQSTLFVCAVPYLWWLAERYRQDSDLSSDEDGLPTSWRGRNDVAAISPPPPPPPPVGSAPASPITPRSRSGTAISRGRHIPHTF